MPKIEYGIDDRDIMNNNFDDVEIKEEPSQKLENEDVLEN